MVKKVTVTLDKERTLQFPVMALIKLKKERGIQLQDLQQEGKAQDLEVILGIVWAGLITEDPELTFEDLGNMVDIATLGELSQHLGTLFSGMAETDLKK